MRTRKIYDTWFASLTVGGKVLVADGTSFLEATSKVLALLGDSNGNN